MQYTDPKTYYYTLKACKKRVTLELNQKRIVSYEKRFVPYAKRSVPCKKRIISYKNRIV